MPKKVDYEELIQFCTSDSERKAVETCVLAGNVRAAAKILNLNPRTVERKIKRVQVRAAKLGHAPGHFDAGVAPGYQIGKVTIQRRPEWECPGCGHQVEDKVIQTWERQSPDEKLLEEVIDVLQEFKVSEVPLIKAPKRTIKSLLTLYTLTDYHLGMYAWAAEGGADWDTDIALQTLFSGIQQMQDGSPDAETAILNIQGDWMHWDGFAAITPMNKHLLDADTRFPRLVEVSLTAIHWMVQKLLEKHKRVHIVVCEGNHDQASSVWMRKHVKFYYDDHKRVTIDDTEVPYYAYLHGKTMIAFHHGHLTKMKDLPAYFSSEPRFRTMWGEAEHCHIHCGHYHTTQMYVDEIGGAIVERHPTLAARDAYAARNFITSRRKAHVITYDDTGDEISRCSVKPPRL